MRKSTGTTLQKLRQNQQSEILIVSFIQRVPEELIDPADRVNDNDNIIQIHSIHSRVMKLHHELYLELMHRPGPLSKFQRELIAVVVSAINGCHY